MSVTRKKYYYSNVFIFILLISSLLSITIINLSASQNSLIRFDTVNAESSLNSNIINVGIAPKGIFFDQDNNFLYVANYASKSISVINVTTNTVTKVINTTGYCWQFAYDPNNKNLYVVTLITEIDFEA